LTPCPPDHDLYSIFFKLRPNRPKLHLVTNGARPLAIHSDDDLSLHWQLQSFATKSWAFKVAANIYMYVTDKGRSLRRRGTTLWPEKVQFTPKATVKLARLKYKGNYDPEPLALERFARLMAIHHQVRVTVLGPLAIAELAASGASLAVLTGTEAFTLSDAEIRALKDFVSAGGTLLIDVAGGQAGAADGEGFVRSVKAALAKMFPQGRLVRLAASAPLYQVKGMEIDKVRWRRRTRKQMAGIRTPMLRAIITGDRPAAIFSPQDLTTGLVGCSAHSLDGYYQGSERKPGTAFELMRNIALYAGKAEGRK
jgi:hypothetical protein